VAANFGNKSIGQLCDRYKQISPSQFFGHV
jgi:hypothetical protein